MKLLLDIGNSRIKWAQAGAAGLVGHGGAGHQDGPLQRILQRIGPLPSDIEEIRVANVAGAVVDDALRHVFGDNPERPVILATTPTSGGPLRPGYDDPSQLGVDRWLAMCAAWHRYQAALCVVDAGTAVTLDVVTEDAVHGGGLIIPGLALMQRALGRGTGGLGRHVGKSLSSSGRATGWLGTDAATGMHNGALLGIASMVDAVMDRLGRSAPDVRLCLTGGDAPLIAPLLRHPAQNLPFLVLEGLAFDPPCFRAVRLCAR